MTSDPLVGAWRLVAWEAHADDGTVAYPFGRDATGVLLYTADGQMAAQLMRPDRPRFAGEDMLGGAEAESAAAFRSYIAYSGRYRVEGDTVFHRVEMSLFPNWIGGEQRRRIEWDGDRLVLVSPPIAAGGPARIHHLIWERARPVSSP